jgi:hypothetical protein
MINMHDARVLARKSNKIQNQFSVLSSRFSVQLACSAATESTK